MQDDTVSGSTATMYRRSTVTSEQPTAPAKTLNALTITGTGTAGTAFDHLLRLTLPAVPPVACYM
jgi:hypothetical protein